MATVTNPTDIERMNAQERKAQARKFYQRSLDGGATLSGKALGIRFGMSERWGRNVIAEAPQQHHYRRV